MEKEKKYLIDNPTLMAEWNWEKNNELGLDPNTLTCGSHKKAWWKCSKGHEWEASIAHRNNGRNCPYCSNNKTLKGYNDLATVNPTLASEWNYEKNGDLKPECFTANSNKKVWWKCSKGHEWEASIAHRNNGRNCPICSGKRILQGYNDLATVNPTLVSEWNYEKNGSLKPEEFSIGSDRKVWWKCSKGHEWQAYISSRNAGSGCPICSSERNTSFPEFAILYYLEKNRIEAIHRRREKGYELDIYIPSKNIAIEYDGGYYHKNKIKKDLEKNLKCKKDGIKLYRIREGLHSLNDTSTDFIVDKSQKDLGEVLQKVLSEIVGFSVDIDLKRDNIEIENLREYTEKTNSLLYTNPQLAKEWNYERNGNLRPEHVLANSEKKIWWKCKKGHEWQATIADRNRGRGCPYCAGKILLLGYNDFEHRHPELLSKWDYSKNTILPSQITYGSDEKVWWVCEFGHSYMRSVNNQRKNQSCPICSGRVVLEGFNDIATTHPQIAQEWSFKHNKLSPSQVSAGSHKKVLWECGVCGECWEAVVYSRVSGHGCPYCSGRKKQKKGS